LRLMRVYYCDIDDRYHVTLQNITFYIIAYMVVIAEETYTMIFIKQL